MKDEEKIRELSRLLAASLGLPLHHGTEAGVLHDDSGKEIWHWWKCPRHLTWMQPCFCHEITHWHCKAEGCGYIRPAKMRTRIEREIFRIMRHLEDNG